MKFQSPVFSKASGSIAGMTFSRNKGGMYVRSRSNPVNPNTTFQQNVRATFSQLTQQWRSTLNAANRNSWASYAEQVLLPDKLGEARAIPALSMFIRCNLPRLQAALTPAFFVQAPAVADIGQLGSVTGAAAAMAGTVAMGWDTADPWQDQDDAALLVYISRPVSPLINYFKGPYRFAGAIPGDSSTPPSTGTTVSSPFAMAVGQRVFGYARATYADGRLTAPRYFTSVAA